MNAKRKMNPLVLIVCAAAAAGLGSVSRAAVITVQQATGDAIVRSSSEKKNFASEPTLELKVGTFGGASEGYVRFDVPRGAGFCDKVQLRLFGRLSSGATAQVAVRSVTGADWSEDTLNWQGRPEHGTTVGNLQVVGVSSAWYEVDVTSYVRSQIANGKSQIHFALVPGEGAKNGVIINSREASTHQPELVFSRPLFSSRISFVPSAATPPPSYSADRGDVFGARSGGLVYGWNEDNRRNIRDRTDAKYKKDKNPPIKTADRRYDFMAYMDNERMTNRVHWEIAVPPSTYRVKVVAGDAYKYDSIFGLTAEGKMVVEGIPDTNKRWIEGTAVVTVSDGRLTIDNAPSSTNNKLCFIEIKEQETLVSKAP
jgi:hypothetical protein